MGYKVVYVDKELYPRDISDEQKRFAEHGVEYIDTQVKGDEDFIEKCKDADAITICYADVNANVLAHLPKTKIIVRTGVGYDMIDVNAATENNIVVCNVPHYCSEEVATQAVGHILNLVRRIGYENRLVHEGKWTVQRQGFPYARLSVQTVGLIGFGAIGRTVAGYMKAFGCKVMAYDPFLPYSVFENAGVIRGTLEEVCREATIFSVHVPYSKDTHHLLGKEQFDMMKDGVYIVNTSRGGLIDQAALCDALDSGKVRAAGLDVLEEEPPEEATKKILDYENVFISPHSGAQGPEAQADLFKQVVDTVLEGLDGSIPKTAVNGKAIAAKRGLN